MSFGKVIEHDGELYLTLSPEAGLVEGDHVYMNIVDDGISLTKVDKPTKLDTIFAEVVSTEIITRVYWVEVINDVYEDIELMKFKNRTPFKTLHSPERVDAWSYLDENVMLKKFESEHGYRVSAQTIVEDYVNKYEND